MSGSKILVSYCVDSCGPRIRIGVDSWSDLLRMKNLFQGLAEGTLREFKLQDLSNVTRRGIEGLTLKVVPREERRTLVRIENQAGNPIFIWARTREGWDDCAALLDGLVASKEPGHQYFSQEGVDSALVELSFQEHSHERTNN